jgi:hypothetical protein
MRQIYYSTSQSERAKAHLICKIYTNSPYNKQNIKVPANMLLYVNLFNAILIQVLMETLANQLINYLC